MYACEQIGARNNSWYCNEEVDKLLISDARTSTDQDLRKANYEKANTMLMEDAAGIFVYNTKWFGPFNKDVKGVRFSPDRQRAGDALGVDGVTMPSRTRNKSPRDLIAGSISQQDRSVARRYGFRDQVAE